MVTSAEANAFPAGLPVGTVRCTASQRAPRWSRSRGSTGWRCVRLFDYGLGGILPPEAAGAARAAARSADGAP